MEVSLNGGSPIAGWFVRENPNLKGMITRGTPILGNHQKMVISVHTEVAVGPQNWPTKNLTIWL